MDQGSHNSARGTMVFLCDGDNCAYNTETIAGTIALGVYRRFLTEECGYKLPEGQVYAWRTGVLVTDAEFIASTPGSAFILMLRGVCEALGHPKKESVYQKWDRIECAACTERFGSDVEAMPGIAEMLSAVRSSELIRQVALVTSSCGSRASACLEATGLAGLFHTVFSAQSAGWVTNGSSETQAWVAPTNYHTVEDYEGTGKPKPHPAVYALACSCLGVDPSRAITVEDSGSGIASAKGAGVGCKIGYLGAAPAESQDALRVSLLEAGADAVVGHHSEVLEVVRSFCQKNSLGFVP